MDYAHNRYLWNDGGFFTSTDKYTFQKPNISGYAYCLNNPIRYTDPDGNWEWDADGNLKAQKGDNAYSLAKFLGTNVKNSLTMLNRGGYTVNDKGVLNLKIGDKLAKNDLWVGGSQSSSGIVVNNTAEAMYHYFNGNGEAADVGDQSTRELLRTPKFQEKHNKITSEIVQPTGDFSVDMTKLTFHIGNTNVDYSVTGNGTSNTVTYTLFSRDGFWDPNFVSEKIGNKLNIDKLKPDGMGPNLEAPGGHPYPYKTRTKTYFFKPPTK